MKELTELQAADAYCRYLAGRHYENFSVASLILPSALRLHLARIYAFCRTTDDLGDESGQSALPRLALWREQVQQCFDEGPDPVHPVLVALRRTIAAFALPTRPFLDLIEANVQDQLVSVYDTWDELRQYCLLSAAPVGRLVLRVFGVQDPRAERLLASGLELEEMVPGRLRLQLALYRLGGMAILAAIRRMGYRTDRARPHVSIPVKAGLVPLAFVQSRKGRGYVRTQRAV